MNAGVRLTLYGAGLVAAFGAAFGIAGVVVPESFVAEWIAAGSDDAPSQSHDTSAAADDEQAPADDAH